MNATQTHAQSRRREGDERSAAQAKAVGPAMADYVKTFVDTAQNDVTTMFEVSEQAAANVRTVIQNNLDSVSSQTRDTIDGFARAFGFSFGEDGERFAMQSQQNMEAVARCGTILTQAVQDTSQSWFELGPKQWRRTVEGFGRLVQARSVQEFAAIQGELLSEGMQQIIQDSRSIAERSLRAADEAQKTFADIAGPSVAPASSKPH